MCSVTHSLESEGKKRFYGEQLIIENSLLNILSSKNQLYKEKVCLSVCVREKVKLSHVLSLRCNAFYCIMDRFISSNNRLYN